MWFPKSLLHKGDGSSSSSAPANENEPPEHYVIDLQHLEGEPAHNKMYEYKATKDGIVVKINIPGCSKLKDILLYRNHVRFTADEETDDKYPHFIQRTYDGTILFKLDAYNWNTISYAIEFGVLTITFTN